MDSGQEVRFNVREHPHLDYGYAVTSHSSQGQTADRVLIHVDTAHQLLYGDSRLMVLPFADCRSSRYSHEASLRREYNSAEVEEDMPKKKKIFKPEDIKEEIEDYVFNRDPPYDELDEVGGPHIVMTDISDIEILRQKSSGDNVSIDGQGTLEVTTDMGDGCLTICSRGILDIDGTTLF